MQAYADLHEEDEDRRIDIIGKFVMRQKKTALVLTDTEPGKAERYIQKIKAKFPGITIIEQGLGPFPATVYIRVGPPLN